MSLLNRLLGKKNRTASWKQRIDRHLVFDFDKFALSGIKIGLSIDMLSFLGPDNRPYTIGNEYCYRDIGIDIWGSEDAAIFEGLTIYISDYLFYKAYRGGFILDGRKIIIDQGITPDQIKEIFRKWHITFERDEKSRDISEARIEQNGKEIEVSWEEGRSLYEIQIYRPTAYTEMLAVCMK